MAEWTIEELKQALRAADAAGDEVGAQRIARQLSVQLSERRGASGALATVAQGATLGLADELAGVAGGPAAQEAARSQVSAFRRESPGLAIGLEAAGGLVPGFGIGQGLARMAQAGGRVGQVGRALTMPAMAPQAGLGAAEGALMGAATGETPEARLMGGAIGAGLGAAGGMAASPITGLLARRFAPGMQAERMVQREMAADLGRPPTRADYARLQQRAFAEPERTLAELSGPAAEMQAVTARNIGGRARGIAEETLEQRRRTMQDRLIASLGENIGTDEGFTAAANRLERQARADATPLYEAAYGTEFVPDEELIALTQGAERRKLLKAGYNRARQSEGIRTGEDLPTWDALVSDDGEGLESLTLAQWDQIKRGMDDQYKTIVRKNPSLARDLWDYRQQIVGKLDELGPDEYRQARAAWAGPKAQQEALDEGRKVFRQDAEYIEDLVQSYSQAERDAFVIGAAQEVRNKLKNVAPEGGMPRFTDLALERIRAAFPSDEAFQEFWQTITAERDMQRFRNLVLAGSQTAPNLAAQERQARLMGAGRGVAEAIQGQPVEGARTILSNILPRRTATIPEAINDPLAEMLFARGAGIPPVLQRLQAPAAIPRMLGPMTTTQAAILANQLQRPRE